MRNALTLNNAKVNGTDIEIRMITGLVNHASKLKMKNQNMLK